jgi:hypothetical protein
MIKGGFYPENSTRLGIRPPGEESTFDILETKGMWSRKGIRTSHRLSLSRDGSCSNCYLSSHSLLYTGAMILLTLLQIILATAALGQITIGTPSSLTQCATTTLTWTGGNGTHSPPSLWYMN